MAGVNWTDSTVEAGGVKLHLKRAGPSGRKAPSVLVLHHETGTLDRLPFYDALAAHYDVLVPHHPGYSRSERPTWMRSVRDVAVMHRGLIVESGPAAIVLERPEHDYTKRLIAAVPRLDRFGASRTV